MGVNDAYVERCWKIRGVDVQRASHFVAGPSMTPQIIVIITLPSPDPSPCLLNRAKQISQTLGFLHSAFHQDLQAPSTCHVTGNSDRDRFSDFSELSVFRSFLEEGC